MEDRVRHRRIAPFVLYGQDLHAPEPDSFANRPAVRYVYTVWRQIDGIGRIERNGLTWEICPGDIAVTEPGCKVSVGEQSRLRVMAFALTGVALSRRGVHYLLDGRTRPQPTWRDLFGVDLIPRIEQDRVEADAMLDFVCANYWRSAGSFTEANARLHLWVARHVRHLEQEATEGGESDDNILGLAEQLMDEDIRTASVAAMAERLRVTRQHLSVSYRKGTGRLLSEEIRRRRLEAAQDRLRVRPDESVAEVAVKVGYRSAAAFIKAFREAFGCTPRVWRRRQG